MRGTPQQRFLAKVEKTDGCWNWTAARTTAGYGHFALAGRVLVYAHRWSYEHHVAPIPAGLVIDHLCRNRACVNPDHLEPVTVAENNRRAPTRRDVCGKGHPFDAENTIVRERSGRLDRQCRACGNERKRAWRARQEVAA